MRYDVVLLPNGIRLSMHGAYCQQPGPDCTAEICSHLLSEPPEVANRMIEHLAAVPELAVAGVSWLMCLAPGADRLLLTYRVPQSELVAAAIGELPVATFRS